MNYIMAKEITTWNKEEAARQNQEATLQKNRQFETLLKDNGMLDEVDRLARGYGVDEDKVKDDQLYEFTLRAAKLTDASFAIDFVCRQVGNAVSTRAYQNLREGERAPVAVSQAISRLKDNLLIRFAENALKSGTAVDDLAQRASTTRDALKAMEQQN
ncbi:hypothetical protein IT413_03465 [Candidatus Peregrinibacteria bacterium]|nr:hypothetical protein [Candidatus Peregrinibacteria bacterium]